MSTRGQFNTKNPTIKRILKEASELASTPSSDLHASPLEDNIFEWHFTLRGPPSPSPYASGIYHGRISLPTTYPLRPPSFRFLTPSGRFEVNREICLSISGHHEETWQPAWGVRTALVALRAFMDGEAKGQLGGLECDRSVRERFAKEGRSWACATCGGRSNEAILKESEKAAKEAGVDAVAEETVPEELRLISREDLEAEKGGQSREQDKIPDKGMARAEDGNTAAAPFSSGTSAMFAPASPVSTSAQLPAIASSIPSPPSDSSSSPHHFTSAQTSSTLSPSQPHQRHATRPSQPRAPPRNQVRLTTDPQLHRGPESSLKWIDTCIYSVVLVLAILVWRKMS